MATPTEPSQESEDPWVSIFLDDGDVRYGRRLISKLRKSKLVEHSGFFRAMFRHDFVETRSNKVTLHDDDQAAVRMLLCAILRGSAKEVFWEDPEELSKEWEIRALGTHSRRVQLLPLLRKYDCPGFEAETLRCIIHCIKQLMKVPWHIDTFLTEHYDPITEIYGGTYPRELYAAFAWAWKAMRRQHTPSERLTTILEQTPGLALFLANFYSDTLNMTEDALYEARTPAEKPVESLTEAHYRSKDIIEALQHIRHALDCCPTEEE